MSTDAMERMLRIGRALAGELADLGHGHAASPASAHPIPGGLPLPR